MCNFLSHREYQSEQVLIYPLSADDLRFLHSSLSLCTDNAAMIAFTAHLIWDQRTNDYTRNARAKWSIEDLASSS